MIISVPPLPQDILQAVQIVGQMFCDSIGVFVSLFVAYSTPSCTKDAEGFTQVIIFNELYRYCPWQKYPSVSLQRTTTCLSNSLSYLGFSIRPTECKRPDLCPARHNRPCDRITGLWQTAKLQKMQLAALASQTAAVGCSTALPHPERCL